MQLNALGNPGLKFETPPNVIGIDAVGDAHILGAFETCLTLKARFPQATSLNFLYTIAGALDNRDWHNITANIKGAQFIKL